MTWEIMAALIALITVGITVGKVIANLSNTLTKLSCAIDALGSSLSDFKKNSDKEHGNIHNDIDHLREDVDNHEKRIIKLEDMV